MNVAAELTDVPREGLREPEQNMHFWLVFACKFGPKSVRAYVKHVARSSRILARRGSPWAAPERLQDHLNALKYRFPAHFISSEGEGQTDTPHT